MEFLTYIVIRVKAEGTLFIESDLSIRWLDLTSLKIYCTHG